MQNAPLATIHTQLIDGGNYPDWAKNAGLPAIAPFWAYVRAQAYGTGRAEFAIQEAAATFQKSEKTIRRWLTIGRRYGLFRDYETRRGLVIVYHSSLFKVCQLLELNNWGATADVELQELSNAKMLATEIQAEQMQRSSQHLAKQKAREEGYHGEIVQPEKLITSSVISPGALVKHVSESRIFVSDQFRIYGASQKGIGAALGRSERTIRRRLSNCLREKNSLPVVLKRQLCQTKPEYKLDYLCNKLCSDGVNDSGSKRLFSISHQNRTDVYRAGCNIYLFSHILRSCKTRKYCFNRFRKNAEMLGKNEGQK